MQCFSFGERDPPPFYNLTCPKFDLVTGETKEARKDRGKCKENTFFVQMRPAESAAPAPEAPRARVAKIIVGYVGKCKGMRDILFERGWLDPSKKYTIANEVLH